MFGPFHHLHILFPVDLNALLCHVVVQHVTNFHSTQETRLLARMCQDYFAELLSTFWTALRSIQMGCLRLK
jgi:hypothetical protein